MALCPFFTPLNERNGQRANVSTEMTLIVPFHFLENNIMMLKNIVLRVETRSDCSLQTIIIISVRCKEGCI